MRLHLKRWLFLLHRWLGIAVCLFFALWFVSGMVMMYVGYPKLTEAERLRHLPPLDGSAALLAPAEALRAAGIDGPLKDLRLHAGSAGRASYLATPEGRRQPVAIDAASGQVLPATSEAQALASARAFAGDGTGLHYLGTVDEDAFSHSRALDIHRPLHRVQLDDAQGTLLYISGRTAEVVRDATRTERGWNYLGAWLHWLYMFRGNAFDGAWADIVNVLSLVGIAVAITGTVVGVMRWRFRQPYRSGRRTPYPGLAMRWHHVAGLLFALTTLAWIDQAHAAPRLAVDVAAPAGQVAAAGAADMALTGMALEEEFVLGPLLGAELLLAQHGPLQHVAALRVHGDGHVLVHPARAEQVARIAQSLVGSAGLLLAALAWGGLWWWLGFGVCAALALLGVRDMTQVHHSVLRNYPIIGHLRFLLEFIRPEMRQYFIE